MLKLLKFSIVLEIALYTKKDFHFIQNLLSYTQMSWSFRKKTEGNIRVLSQYIVY